MSGVLVEIRSEDYAKSFIWASYTRLPTFGTRFAIVWALLRMAGSVLIYKRGF